MVVDDRRGRIIGRDHEMQMLLVLVQALTAGQGGSMVIAGPAGSGKSTLLAAVVAETQGTVAGERPVSVASVTAAESEREWPYAGLHLVLSGLIGALEPGDQKRLTPHVEEILAGLGDDASPYDVAMRVQTLLGLTETPILVTVDNAHFFDLRSQEVLGFVARRLRPWPVALMLTGNPSAPAPVLDGLPMLRLGELEQEDAIDLVRTRYDDVAVNVAADLSRRVGGNPRALLDVAGELAPEQRRGQVPLDRYLPASQVLRELLIPDLGELDDDQRFALLVATVSEDHKLAPVLSALAEHDDDVVEWLLREHVEVSDGTFRLRTPAVGSIVWRAASLNERVRAHTRLAEVYRGLDADQVLWHQARACVEHDDELATALQQAARELLGRGEFQLSVRFAQESVRLTSSPDERIQRLLLSGEFALFAGRASEAVHIARERSRMDMPPASSTELALLEARARLAREGHVPTDLIEGQAEALAATDPDRAAQFWIVGAAGFADSMEVGEAVKYLAQAKSLLPEVSDSTRGTYRRIAAWTASLSGDWDRARELIEADSSAGNVFADADRCVRHAGVLARLERYDEARRLYHVITEQRRFGDSPAVVGYAYSALGVMEIRAGRLIAAKEAAEAWQQLIGPTVPHRGKIQVYMIRAYALMGDLTAARRCLDLARLVVRQRGDWWTRALVQAESGAMYLQVNQLDDAMPALERARDYALTYDDPSVLASEPDFIEACARLGDLERARAALAAFEIRASRVPTVWAQHTLARCRALVAEGDESVKLFSEASKSWVESVSPVELARTQLCYGERLRRLGRRSEAAEWLRRAVVLAGEVGAMGLAERAEEELGSGRSAAAVESSSRADTGLLTEAEQRIVRLVATGRRNREIAAELYVSVRTVETHLGRVFRKLGVRSRAELASLAAVAKSPPSTPEE
ncbi:AAA family ATPase [Phytoactinopolyspora alkaliphila]|uniref:AAA family ATPase n=1 Tax=Phytoactinopolyspora alkaliphila TaxID=1783498 RepID=A0A6N9YQJ2_9ACTN|nr:AAA family ATPase [Phytoactinopolyspora alkaliphila]